MAANVIELAKPGKGDTVCIVCTPEDADFLARGLIEGLQEEGVEPARLKLVCFWNERVKKFLTDDRFDVAPIIKEYREDVKIDQSIVVVLKSIIRGTCVVKTNLATLIERSLPKAVIVAAPVMLIDAEKRLESEFSANAARLFQYLAFAIDTERDGDDVKPGIGGSPYVRLDVEKSGYIPDIVKRRRLTAHVA
jgi:hypothetical protein